VPVSPEHGKRPSKWSSCRLMNLSDASSMSDSAGPMTRTVADSATLLTVLAGQDAGDPCTLSQPTGLTDYAALLKVDALAGKRIGIPRNLLRKWGSEEWENEIYVRVSPSERRDHASLTAGPVIRGRPRKSTQRLRLPRLWQSYRSLEQTSSRWTSTAMKCSRMTLHTTWSWRANSSQPSMSTWPN
jgi:hypothetical protein